jgi:beta-1,4-N-acetylglucosaminyltransferase
MRLFVTVGTTKFDYLVQKVLSEEVLQKLRDRGFTEVTLQTGKSDFDKKG